MRPAAAAIVTRTTIYVSSAGHDQIHRLARMQDLLPSLFGDLARDPDFAGRTTLAIAGAPDVTYRDVVDVITLAAAAGFTDWRLATPRDLPPHLRVIAGP